MSDLSKNVLQTIERRVAEIVDDLRGNRPEAVSARLALMAALSTAFCTGCGKEQVPGKRACPCEDDS